MNAIEIAERQNAKLHDELEVATARILNLEAQTERIAELQGENQRTREALYVSNEQLREAERRASAAEDGLRALVRFAASVWYDEGNCTAEEEEAMHAARVALSKL